ncbi:hypothetical protein IFM89_007867 [Coptis chinensis]|uniref:Protein kinase domain-containing protein n=1 Tax=Coptis chinensis TaxID=261450 RepID=A0A835GZV8_9MAGN|nr:hypothetical protein IFM89_007867 [Coptis chinensis]
MAVKSAKLGSSRSLQKENFILADLQGSPNVLGYYGDDVSIEKGRQFYNLFLEYASLGSIGDRVRRCSRVGLPKVEVKGFTKGILKGLKHVHKSNYVHCDLKLDNVLLVQTSDGVVPKLEDFGLAKGVGKKKQQGSLRGTPLYMALESIHYAEYEPK